jgi:hypothetical protein
MTNIETNESKLYEINDIYKILQKNKLDTNKLDKYLRNMLINSFEKWDSKGIK